MRYYSLGYTADTSAQTPNIDNFASESGSYRQVVSSMPVCSAARASSFAGKYTISTGMVINELRMNPNHQCLAHILINIGYETAYIGKWYLWANQLGNHDKISNSFVPPGLNRLGFDGYWPGYNRIIKKTATLKAKSKEEI
ncbi:MAG: sulfatase-like hydrolase/transferase [Promethearchaeota archaeon]